MLAKTQLIETRAGARAHRKTARRDFGEQRPFIARRGEIETLAAIGDEPCKNIEPTRRALGVGRARQILGQSESLHQRNDVKTSALQNGAVAFERNLVGF